MYFMRVRRAAPLSIPCYHLVPKTKFVDLGRIRRFFDRIRKLPGYFLVKERRRLRLMLARDLAQHAEEKLGVGARNVQAADQTPHLLLRRGQRFGFRVTSGI